MKKKITVATFISNNEKKNSDFDKLCELLSAHYNIDVYIYSDQKIDTRYTNIVGKKTKYFRIIDLIDNTNNNDILFVDNDITMDKSNILKFVNDVINSDYALAWGIIRTAHQNNFVEKLIDIDKMISHYIIRPFSWKFNFGISLPGQVFMLNRKYYLNKLPKIDTLYDDLEIGAVAKKNNMPIRYTKYILGYEEPKSSFKNLLIQRKRWAQGFIQTVYMNKKTKVEKYVIIHGIIFNMLWLPVNTLLMFIAFKNIYLFFSIFMILCFWYSQFNLRKIIYSAIYILIFWIVYFIWLINIIRFLFFEEGIIWKLKKSI